MGPSCVWDTCNGRVHECEGKSSCPWNPGCGWGSAGAHICFLIESSQQIYIYPPFTNEETETQRG